MGQRCRISDNGTLVSLILLYLSSFLDMHGVEIKEVTLSS